MTETLKDERIVYPSLDDFFHGLRTYRHYNPDAKYRTWKDPRSTQLGITDGYVTHIIAMETFRAYYGLVGFANAPRQAQAWTSYNEVVKEILEGRFNSSR